MKDAKIVFFTCASKYVGDVSAMILPYFNKDMIICIASKGIDEKTCNLLSNIVKFILNSKNITVISGPTFAIDMLNNEPVALAIAGTNNKSQNEVITALSGKTIKLRKSKDLIGIQICGSIKNIIAIASGILGGLGYSESTRAFLINESLHDIKNLIHYMGGKKKTILSFAGVGDLLMTCMSTKSRNYSFGYIIGKTKDKNEIEKYLKNNTVEGLNTLKTVLIILKRKNISIPLITLINDIINFEKDPESLAEFLINKK